MTIAQMSVGPLPGLDNGDLNLPVCKLHGLNRHRQASAAIVVSWLPREYGNRDGV